MAKVIITEKGAKMPVNKWKEGQEISCHENLAKYFIEKGIAVNPEDYKPADSDNAEGKKSKKK